VWVVPLGRPVEPDEYSQKAGSSALVAAQGRVLGQQSV
jgi:hypothetical protein